MQLHMSGEVRRVYTLACGVPSVTRWCQNPEISGRLGQEEVGAALLREGDVWNSYSTIHGPKKGDFFNFFFSNGALSPEREPEKCVLGKLVGPADPDDVGC